jgi:hypothetical protein
MNACVDAMYLGLCNRFFREIFIYTSNICLHILCAEMFVDKLFVESPSNPPQRIFLHNLYATITMLVVYFFLGKNSINVNAIHNLQFWN